MSLNEYCKSNVCGVFTALFLIGLFNNNGYVLVAAGAATLADEFNREKMMPMF